MHYGKNTIAIPTNKSIAVLPFVNLSSDPENEYFSDGITEEIINALTKVEGLKVIARTSTFAFKGKNIDVREIANQLGVKTVLEGSVRKSGNRVRITSQLINAEDGTHFWSKNFDRQMEDIFKVQDEISLLIADQIRENFGHFDIQEHLFDSHTKSVEAYNEYQKGRYWMLNWSVENFHKAISYYKKSLEIDPRYPLPHFGIVMSYTYLFSWGAVEKKDALEITNLHLDKLKEINFNLPEYHLAVSSCSILFDWNIDLAHKELQKTLQINPNQTEALESLAGLYIVTAWFEEGLQIIDKALGLNPLSANSRFMKGNIYYFKGEYNKAITWFDKSLEIEPNMTLAVQVKLSCLILLGETSKFENFVKKNNQFSFVQHYKNLKELYSGKTVSIKELPLNFENEFQPWKMYFEVYSGNIDDAINTLNQGLENKIGLYFCFRHDPFLKPIKNNPQFLELQQKYLISSFSKSPSKTPTNTESLKLTTEEKEYFLNELKKIMDEEQAFLDPALSLKSLSDRIQIHPNKLSWLINHSHHKNFNEYVNHYRLTYFKEIARDDKNENLTILGMAFESGFNSKTSFNAYFKKTENTTPGEWLRQTRR